MDANLFILSSSPRRSRGVCKNDAASACAAGEQGVARKGGRTHARNGFEALEDPLVEIGQPIALVTDQVRADAEKQESLGVEPGLNVLQVAQRPDKKSGADEQHQRHRHLRNDQCFTEQRPGNAARTSGALFERRRQIDPRRAQCRGETKKDPGQQGEPGGEAEDA